MADKLDLVIQRIDDLKDSSNDRLDSIDSNLLEHMKRTAVAEKRLEHIEDRLTLTAILKVIVTFSAGTGTIAGAAYAIFKVIEYIGG
jgi:hypothetical protein